jgi:hypothetical protein
MFRDLCPSLPQDPAPQYAAGHGGGSPASAPATAEEALVAVAHVAAVVQLVLSRYPDILLGDPRAVWLRDEIGRQILEYLADLPIQASPVGAPLRPPAPATAVQATNGYEPASRSSEAAPLTPPPLPPAAAPQAATAADAIALRWETLQARERTAGGDTTVTATAVGTRRARIYRPRCPDAASSGSGTSPHADAA